MRVGSTISRPQLPDLVEAMASRKLPKASLIFEPWQQFRTKASSRSSSVIFRSVGNVPVAST